jgi:phage shock protein PspC (stress-responsive transcriptional regulator)
MTQDKVVKKVKVHSKKNERNMNVSEEKRTDQPETESRHEHYYYNPNNYHQKTLYRSTTNRWLGGVCGGMAEYFNQDPVLIRLMWVLVTIISVGLGLIGYILFWIFVKKAPIYYPYNYQSINENPSGEIHYHYHYKTPEAGQ